MTDSQQIVNKAWNLAHMLRDDGLSYMPYMEHITFLLIDAKNWSAMQADVKGDIYEGLHSNSAGESSKGRQYSVRS